jgi:hypothetical protein
LPPPPTTYSSSVAQSPQVTPAYQSKSAQTPADTYLPPTPTYQSAATAAASNYGAAQQPGYEGASIKDPIPSDSYLPPTAVFQQSNAGAISSGSYGAGQQSYNQQQGNGYSNRQGLSTETTTAESYSKSVIDGQLFHGDYHQKVASSSTTASYGEAASTFYNQGSASSETNNYGAPSSNANYPANNALGASTNSYNRARSVVYSPVGWRLF